VIYCSLFINFIDPIIFHNKNLIMIKTKKNIDFTSMNLDDELFEDICFENCIFKSMKIKGTEFDSCIFKDCDFSLSTLDGVSFSNIEFLNSKFTGVDFSLCNTYIFDAKFIGCIMHYSIFSGMNLSNFNFKDSIFYESDFTDCNLNSSVFYNCNMERVAFEGASLINSDLSTSFNICINPITSKVKGMKISQDQAGLILSSFGIKVIKY